MNKTSSASFVGPMTDTEAADTLPMRVPPSPFAPLRFVYTNHRGETAERTVSPFSVWFGTTPEHPTPQWFLIAFCHDRKADRSFAMKDIKRFL